MPLAIRLSAACFSLCLSGAVALAQTTEAPADAAPATVGEAHGDWLLRCAANDPSRCALTQRIVNSDTRDVVAEVGIARLANGSDGFAIVYSVPEGADLSTAPAFRLEGSEDQTAMAWRVCTNQMCQASASIDVDAATAMEASGRAIFGYRKYRTTKLTVTPVSFAGLADGIAAMAAK